MSSGQSEYERRAARQRQLDLMEASASGVLPTMELNTSDSGEFASMRHRNQESARRFLCEEDEAEAGKRSSVNTAHAQLFGPRDTGNTVNLMDHETGVYSESGGTYGTHFVDAIFGVGSADILDAAGEAHLYAGNKSRPQGRASRTSMLCVKLRERSARGRRRRYFVLGLAIFAVILSFMLLTGDSESHQKEILFEENTERYEAIKEMLIRTGISKPETFDDESSTEHDALRWVAYSDKRRLDPSDPMLVQRYILAVFYYGSYNDFVRDHGVQPDIEYEGVQSERVPVPGFHRRDYWLTEKGVCMWYGVTCEEKDGNQQYDGDARIVGFDMHSNTVYGHLPREFKGLSSLKHLNLAGNQLKGTFPPELGRMFWIKKLELQDNSFTGELPNLLGYLEGVEEVDLSNNRFSGSVPLDLERLYNLRKLNLDNNILSGEFPSIGGLENLETLILSRNNFSKRIPQSFTSLTNLVELNLEFNQFSGAIPTGFKLGEKLTYLKLQKNALSGRIPIGMFDTNKDLKEISLEYNQLTGGLPTTIGGLENLVSLKLNDNLLEGPIPEEWNNTKSLELLHIQNNKLKGPLPDSLGTMKKVLQIWLYNNKITGKIPAALGGARSVEEILLNDNELTGNVPAEVSNLENLNVFHLENNDLTGKIPAEICSLKDTKALSTISVDCGAGVECDCCGCE